MKAILRVVAALLCIASTAALLPACANTAEPLTTTKEEPALNIMQKTDPAQDDTLNILMIGSSFCYYYVEELHGMLKAAGIKARVCNVYYSGCPLSSHWEWWKSGEANYDFFVTDDTGRNKTELTNLEYCLQQGNWDIISLQESTSKIRNSGAQVHMAITNTYLTDLWGYLKEQFPMARYLWHQPWSYQVGYDRNGYQMKDLAQQLADTIPVKDYAIAVCKAFDLERINSGEAWDIVRQNGYDNLCARQSINAGVGDYYHDGDIGGGQYLNACVWFEVITGQSCIGNTYRPDYQGVQLSEDLIKLLQESAHQAIEQMKTEAN